MQFWMAKRKKATSLSLDAESLSSLHHAEERYLSGRTYTTHYPYAKDGSRQHTERCAMQNIQRRVPGNTQSGVPSKTYRGWSQSNRFTTQARQKLIHANIDRIDYIPEARSRFNNALQYH